MTRTSGKFAENIPTHDALVVIARCSPAGVMEVRGRHRLLGAGLHRRGVDVEAFDIEPPPSARSRWFAGDTTVTYRNDDDYRPTP